MNKLYNISLQEFLSNESKKKLDEILSGVIKKSNKKFRDFIEYKSINKDKSKFNIIIPYYNRGTVFEYVLNYLIRSIGNNDEFSITVVEMSEKQTVVNFCKDRKINYVWVDITKNGRFNKSLCMNIGTTISESEWYMFYDIDLVSTDDFISKVIENIGENYKVVQCFKHRKVIPIYEKQLDSLINGETQISSYSTNLEDYKDDETFIPFNAPGGIMLIEKQIFNKVGGFDDLLFEGWGYEDTFMWNKLSHFTQIKSANTPEISVFHLYHPKSEEGDNNSNIFETIDNLDKNHLFELIEKLSEIFLSRLN